MPTPMRIFKLEDPVTIWDLLNELGAKINELLSSGTSARYWTGTLVPESLPNDRHVSVRMSQQTEAMGDVQPSFDEDTFKLPAGRYRIDVQVRFDQASGGYRSLALMRNPGVKSYSSTTGPPGTYVRSAQFATSTNDTTVQMTKLLTVAATDVFMLVARQTSGGTVALVASTQDSELMIQRLGD